MDSTNNATGHVRRALAEAAQMIKDLPDPLDRDRAAVDLGTYLRVEATAEARTIRQENVLGLRSQGQTWAEVGKQIGKTAAHARDIAGGRSGGSADKKAGRPDQAE